MKALTLKVKVAGDRLVLTEDPMAPPKLVDLCLCGHDREVHMNGFEGCLICTRKGPIRKFTCRPGTCDRFTWNYAAEVQA